MQYVFGFDLKYKKYKKNFRCIIHLDDMMLDDFELHEDKNFKKLYIVDIDKLDKIKITNYCEDSNYVNGFQTKSATYQFREFIFAPACLMNHDIVKKIKQKKFAIRERMFPDYWTNPEWKNTEPKEILQRVRNADTWPVFNATRVHHLHKNLVEPYLISSTLTESAELEIAIKQKHNILMSLPVNGFGNIEVRTKATKNWINIYNENT